MRNQNSKRQFKIRSKKKKEKGGKRGKPLKSPSDFTQGGKSTVSMFTTHTGKTNYSAPIGLGQSLTTECSPNILIK